MVTQLIRARETWPHRQRNRKMSIASKAEDRVRGNKWEVEREHANRNNAKQDHPTRFLLLFCVCFFLFLNLLDFLCPFSLPSFHLLVWTKQETTPKQQKKELVHIQSSRSLHFYYYLNYALSQLYTMADHSPPCIKHIRRRRRRCTQHTHTNIVLLFVSCIVRYCGAVCLQYTENESEMAPISIVSVYMHKRPGSELARYCRAIVVGHLCILWICICPVQENWLDRNEKKTRRDDNNKIKK